MPGGFPLGLEVCNGNDQGTDTANSRGTAVVAGSSSYGSYVQLAASTSSDTCWMTVTLNTNGVANNGNQGKLKLAVGAIGSEKDFAIDLICQNGGAFYGISTYSFPISIPAGSRISVAAYQTGHTDTFYASVILWDGGFTQLEGCAGVDAIGISGDHGTSVSPGAANVKGSYAQLTASTARDYVGLMLYLDGLDLAGPGQTNLLVDIAIGANGSEQIIVPNWPFVGDANIVMGNSVFLPIPIPAGTRVAARMQNTLGTNNAGLTVYGVYQ